MDNTIEKRTVSTEYGDAEVQIVECAGCDMDVTIHSAKEISIGGDEGWACSFCAGEPASVLEDRSESDEEPLGIQLLSALALTFFFLPLLLLLLVPFGVTVFSFPQGISIFTIGLFLMMLAYYRIEGG